MNTGYEKPEKEVPTDALTAMNVLVMVLVGFDLAALWFGTDSRDRIPDDHAR
jgi:hypothetical protein